MKALLSLVFVCVSTLAFAGEQQPQAEQSQVPKAYAVVPSYALMPLPVREVKTYVIDAPARPAYVAPCCGWHSTHLSRKITRLQARYARRYAAQPHLYGAYPYNLPIVVK